VALRWQPGAEGVLGSHKLWPWLSLSVLGVPECQQSTGWSGASGTRWGGQARDWGQLWLGGGWWLPTDL